MGKVTLNIFIFLSFILLGFSEIIDLTEANFDSEINSNTMKHLITFYSP